MISPHRLAWPRTPPFQGGDTGSNPVGDANRQPPGVVRRSASRGADGQERAAGAIRGSLRLSTGVERKSGPVAPARSRPGSERSEPATVREPAPAGAQGISALCSRVRRISVIPANAGMIPGTVRGRPHNRHSRERGNPVNTPHHENFHTSGERQRESMRASDCAPPRDRRIRNRRIRNRRIP